MHEIYPRPALSRLLAAAVAAAALTAWVGTPSARAQSLGVEVDLGIPVGDTADVLDLGWGVGGRLGLGLPVPALSFDLEAIFQYYSFPLDAFDESANLWRLAGGLRIGLGVPFVPELFAHLGYGKLSFTQQTADVSVEATQEGFTWDVGLSSDLFSLPIVSFGIHLAYVKLVPDDPTTFVALGIHGEFGF